jgi:azurin
MRIVYLYFLSVIFLATSCSQNKDGGNSNAVTSDTTQSAENIETTVPGVEKLNFTDTIRLQANENMRFNKDLFRVYAGKKLALILKNTGAMSNTSMAHNVVILKSGMEIADFADVAHTVKSEQFVPSSLSSWIIAHTRLVSGGDSDTVGFIIPKAGVYNFICSYPGHWGTMQGKIVAE